MPIRPLGARDYKAMPDADVRARGAQPRSHRAVCLVALHARPEAQEPAAPHPHSDTVAVGASDRILSDALRPRLLRAIPGAKFETIEAPAISRISSSPKRSRAASWRSSNRSEHRSTEPSMRVFHFTEQPYPDAWKTTTGSLRVNLPNRKLDPRSRPICSTAITTSGCSPTSSVSTSCSTSIIRPRPA